jgi:hypothetical protein
MTAESVARSHLMNATDSFSNSRIVCRHGSAFPHAMVLTVSFVPPGDRKKLDSAAFFELDTTAIEVDNPHRQTRDCKVCR